MIFLHEKANGNTLKIPELLETQSKNKRVGKGKICFGSGLERKLLESDTKGLTSRHARTYLKENLSVSPATYEISSKFSSMSSLLNRPTSTLGTVLGGRRAKRKFFPAPVLSPGPGDYYLPPMFADIYLESCAPFNSTSEKIVSYPNYPGVGTYNPNLPERRTLDFKHTFGGKTCLYPSVRIKCGPFNFDKCERCQKFPEGDYWFLEATVSNKKSKKNKQITSEIYLCRPCYDIEKKEYKMYNKKQMQNFKKIRDCSKIHFHDGCKGKLFLVPPQEISKLKEREGYLSLYFK